MKKTILATAIALTSVTGFAAAEEAASPLSFNAAVVTDYRYRGLAQTRFDPAIQVGADYGHDSGLYAGTWVTNVSWIKDGVHAAGQLGKGDVEWDLYAGYSTEIGAGFSMDIGGLYYYYPGNNNDVVGKNANTFEVYAGLGYGPVSLKYSHATTNLFGAANSKNSGYVDLSGEFDIGANVSIGAHVGYQLVKNGTNYVDWKLGVSRTFDALNGLAIGLDYVGTNVKKGTLLTPDGKNMGRDGVVVSLSKSF